MNTGESGTTVILRAVSFAATKHKEQRRKDDVTPYINHPIAVAEILVTIGGVDDVATIAGAILHDTIEDTETTGAELEAHFGREVRGIVEEVTDDKNLPKAVRKQLQIEHAPHKSHAAKCVKLADKIANLTDIIEHPPTGWSGKRKKQYVEWAAQVVAGLRGVNAPLEAQFDRLYAQARRPPPG